MQGINIRLGYESIAELFKVLSIVIPNDNFRSTKFCKSQTSVDFVIDIEGTKLPA